MRDFTQLLKNKLRSRRYFGGSSASTAGSTVGGVGKKTPRLGYLPVSASADRPGSALDGIDPYAAYAASLTAMGSPQRSLSRQEVVGVVDGDAASTTGASDGGGSGSSARVTPQQHTEPTRRPFQHQQGGEGGTFA